MVNVVVYVEGGRHDKRVAYSVSPGVQRVLPARGSARSHAARGGVR